MREKIMKAQLSKKKENNWKEERERESKNIIQKKERETEMQWERERKRKCAVKDTRQKIRQIASTTEISSSLIYV